jgi:hypothetical protein
MALIAGKQSIIVSIAEPVNLVKQVFREYTAKMISQTNNFVNKDVLDYNTVPFITAMLNDIFADVKINEIPLSTQMLINDGLEKQLAIQVALSVYKSIVSSISEYATDIDFTSDGYRCTICGDYDVHIAPAYLDNFNTDASEYEILNNQPSLKDYR